MKKRYLGLSLCLAFAAVFYFYTPIPKTITETEKTTKPLATNEQPLPETSKIDRLVVFKSKREMWAYLTQMQKTKPMPPHKVNPLEVLLKSMASEMAWGILGVSIY